MKGMIEELISGHSLEEEPKEEELSSEEEIKTSETEVESEEELQEEPLEAEEETDRFEVLLAEVQSLKDQLTKQNSNKELPPEEEVDPLVPPKPELIEFMTGDEFTEAMTSPEAFNKVLGRVYARAKEDAARDSVKLTQQAVRRQTALDQAVREFWRENKDLIEGLDTGQQGRRRKYIGITANEVAAENPSWSAEQVYAETASRVREDLGLHEKAKEVVQKKRKGTFAGKGRKVRRIQQDEEPTALQNEIEQLISGR